MSAGLEYTGKAHITLEDWWQAVAQPNDHPFSIRYMLQIHTLVFLLSAILKNTSAQQRPFLIQQAEVLSQPSQENYTCTSMVEPTPLLHSC